MNQDFINALMGGGLIGLSAFLLLLFLGKVCGISGIVGGAISTIFGPWRWTFIAGLLLSGLIMSPLNVEMVSLASSNTGNLVLFVLAGLIVGVGTTLGSGCTSGHGIVGIGRFSKRSMVATLTFMASGIVTVFVTSQFA